MMNHFLVCQLYPNSECLSIINHAGALVADVESWDDAAQALKVLPKPYQIHFCIPSHEWLFCCFEIPAHLQKLSPAKKHLALSFECEGLLPVELENIVCCFQAVSNRAAAMVWQQEKSHFNLQTFTQVPHWASAAPESMYALHGLFEYLQQLDITWDDTQDTAIVFEDSRKQCHVFSWQNGQVQRYWITQTNEFEHLLSAWQPDCWILPKSLNVSIDSHCKYYAPCAYETLLGSGASSGHISFNLRDTPAFTGQTLAQEKQQRLQLALQIIAVGSIILGAACWLKAQQTTQYIAEIHQKQRQAYQQAMPDQQLPDVRAINTHLRSEYQQLKGTQDHATSLARHTLPHLEQILAALSESPRHRMDDIQLRSHHFNLNGQARSRADLQTIVEALERQGLLPNPGRTRPLDNEGISFDVHGTLPEVPQ